MPNQAADRPALSRSSIGLALVLLVLATYASVIRFPFINFDDPMYVVENPFVRQGLSWDGAREAFRAGYAGNWHPLTWFSHMLDVELFGLRPGWHHATSVVLHALNAVLVFLMLEAMLDAARRGRPDLAAARWISGIGAAIFAIHPLRLESVAWVAERKDVLSASFWLLAVLAYLRYARQPSVARYVPVFVALALGLLAKPMLVTLPLILLLLDVWPLGRFVPRRVGTLFVEKLPLFLLVALSSWITVVAQQAGRALSSLEAVGLAARTANAAVASVSYLLHAIRPLNLAVFYPIPLEGWEVWRVTASLAFLAGVTLLALAGVRQRPWLGVGWFWYLVALIPVSGLVQVGLQAGADRYTYIPQLGLLVILTGFLGWLLDARPALLKPVVGAGVVVIVLLALATTLQLRYWSDTVLLFNRAIAVTRDNYLAHHSLSVEYVSRGDMERATGHAAEAVRLHPTYPTGREHLGTCLALQGRLEEAIAELREAIRLRPSLARAQANLGAMLIEAGHAKQSLDPLYNAVRLEPTMIEAHVNLGLANERLGQLDDARRAYRDAIELDETYVEVWVNLGALEARAGNDAAAVESLSRALSLEPENVRGLATMAAIDLRRGDLDSAMERYRRLLPNDSAVAAILRRKIAAEDPARFPAEP